MRDGDKEFKEMMVKGFSCATLIDLLGPEGYAELIERVKREMINDIKQRGTVGEAIRNSL